MYDQLYKIIILGDSGVGKSCLLLKFSENKFDQFSIATIGIEFKVKHIKIDDKKIKLHIWDTSGQEKFNALTRSYYRDSDGIIIVYDVTNQDSFKNINKWVNEIYSYVKDPTIILIGNKTDLVSERKISLDTAKQFATEMNAKLFEISTKDSNILAIEEIFLILADEINLKKEKVKVELNNIKIHMSEKSKNINCCSK